MTRSKSSLVSLEVKSYSAIWKAWRKIPTWKRETRPETLPSSIRVITWNIDFASWDCKGRLLAVLEYLQHDVLAISPGQSLEPCCILLQEVSKEALPILLANSWVRKNFLVTPTLSSQWPFESYGVVTLISKDIPVKKAQSLVFDNSRMGRNAVIVDLRLAIPSSATNHFDSANSDSDTDSSDSQYAVVTFRVANTHLESLPIGAPARPVQLSNISEVLKEKGVDGGMVCGDMNAIGPSDVHIHEDAGLIDAWTGRKDDEEGYTWGYQPPSQFPVGRLDKVFYTSDEKWKVDKPQRIGVELRADSGQWASDHFGLVTSVATAR